MTDESFWKNKGYVKQPNGEWTHHSNLPDSRKPPQLEQNIRNEPLAKSGIQKKVSKRILVRITSYRRRLIDEDNLCEKYHVDLLRYASAIPSDAPDQCKIEVSQVKSKEEYVKIEVIR